MPNFTLQFPFPRSQKGTLAFIILQASIKTRSHPLENLAPFLHRLRELDFRRIGRHKIILLNDARPISIAIEYPKSATGCAGICSSVFPSDLYPPPLSKRQLRYPSFFYILNEWLDTRGEMIDKLVSLLVVPPFGAQEEQALAEGVFFVLVALLFLSFPPSTSCGPPVSFALFAVLGLSWF